MNNKGIGIIGLLSLGAVLIFLGIWMARHEVIKGSRVNKIERSAEVRGKLKAKGEVKKKKITKAHTRKMLKQHRKWCKGAQNKEACMAHQKCLEYAKDTIDTMECHDAYPFGGYK